MRKQVATKTERSQATSNEGHMKEHIERDRIGFGANYSETYCSQTPL